MWGRSPGYSSTSCSNTRCAGTSPAGTTARSWPRTTRHQAAAAGPLGRDSVFLQSGLVFLPVSGVLHLRLPGLSPRDDVQVSPGHGQLKGVKCLAQLDSLDEPAIRLGELLQAEGPGAPLVQGPSSGNLVPDMGRHLVQQLVPRAPLLAQDERAFHGSSQAHDLVPVARPSPQSNIRRMVPISWSNSPEGSWLCSAQVAR